LLQEFLAVGPNSHLQSSCQVVLNVSGPVPTLHVRQRC